MLVGDRAVLQRNTQSVGGKTAAVENLYRIVEKSGLRLLSSRVRAPAFIHPTVFRSHRQHQNSTSVAEDSSNLSQQKSARLFA
jgi:hypothetical protein